MLINHITTIIRFSPPSLMTQTGNLRHNLPVFYFYPRLRHMYCTTLDQHGKLLLPSMLIGDSINQSINQSINTLSNGIPPRIDRPASKTYYRDITTKSAPLCSPLAPSSNAPNYTSAVPLFLKLTYITSDSVLLTQL